MAAARRGGVAAVVVVYAAAAKVAAVEERNFDRIRCRPLLVQCAEILWCLMMILKFLLL